MANWRSNVEAINGLLFKTQVDLPLSEEERLILALQKGYLPDTTGSTLCRIFNNGRFSQGGRFYGHWVQGIPKEFRQKLRIDGEAATELDYSGLHINMLYLLAGHEPPEEDVYSLPGLDSGLRPLLKFTLLALLNAKSQREAIKAVFADSLYRESGLTSMELKEIVTEFIGRHEPIKRFIGSGIGLDLQHRDSCIAERILLDLKGKGIACVPIHDSFVVRASYEAELRHAMDRAFIDEFSAPIRIDKKF